MKTQTVIEKDDVVSALARIALESGSSENPTDLNGNCVYTDGKGRHCLIGEFFQHMFGKVPPADARKVQFDGVGEWLQDQGIVIEDDAMRLLASAQSLADAAIQGSFGRRPWRDAVALLFFDHRLVRPEEA